MSCIRTYIRTYTAIYAILNVHACMYVMRYDVCVCVCVKQRTAGWVHGNGYDHIPKQERA